MTNDKIGKESRLNPLEKLWGRPAASHALGWLFISYGYPVKKG
jgi:hypothetical protein